MSLMGILNVKDAPMLPVDRYEKQRNDRDHARLNNRRSFTFLHLGHTPVPMTHVLTDPFSGAVRLRMAISFPHTLELLSSHKMIRPGRHNSLAK